MTLLLEDYHVTADLVTSDGLLYFWSLIDTAPFPLAPFLGGVCLGFFRE